MLNNNRTTTIVGTTMDKIRIAKRNIEAAKKVDINRDKSAIEELNRTIELLHSGKYLIKESDHMLINSKKYTWNKKTATGDIDTITKELKKLTSIGDKGLNFFEIIGDKTNSSKDMLGMTIRNLDNVVHTKQRGSANESINS